MVDRTYLISHEVPFFQVQIHFVILSRKVLEIPYPHNQPGLNVLYRIDMLTSRFIQIPVQKNFLCEEKSLLVHSTFLRESLQRI